MVSYIISIFKHYLYFSTHRSLINFVSEDQQGTQNASIPLIIHILLRDVLDCSSSFALIKHHKYTHIIAGEMAVGMKVCFPIIYILLLSKRTDIKSVIFSVFCGVHQCSEVRTIYLTILSSTQEKVLDENTDANCCDEVVQVQYHYLLKDFMRKVTEFTSHVSLKFKKDRI